jgi:hypothetical protein
MENNEEGLEGEDKFEEFTDAPTKNQAQVP